MPRLRTTINLIIFSAVVVVIIFGTRWYEGYKKETRKFTDYVKTDLKDIEKGIETIPEILSEAVSSGNILKKSYVDKMAGVIETYADDHGKYPETLQDLVPEYLNETALKQKNFYYKNTRNGYEIGMTLGNGETYKIEK